MDYFTNCYIGLTPVVTYRRAWDVQDTAIKVPLHRLLLETDAPYFVPYYVSLGWCRTTFLNLGWINPQGINGVLPGG